MKPTADRVLVRNLDDDTDEKTGGGIIIPGAFKDDSLRGVVLGMGPEVKKKFPDLKLGDQVMVSPRLGTEFLFHGHKHYILRAEELIGVFDRN